jgi:hypothetical protein
MGYIILGIVTVILLGIAGIFIWVEMDEGPLSRSDGFGGCLAIIIVGIVLALWTLVGIISLFR